MKRRAAYRNEVKTRLDDRTYEALLRYQALHGTDSLSSALARITGMALLGVIGILPADLSGISDDAAQTGTR